MSCIAVETSSELVTHNRATATLSKPDQPQTVTIPLAEEVEERYLEIRDTKTGRVVTTIELLSPKNKRAGEGREAYLRKRQQILISSTHFVEIDLLRGGKAMPMQCVAELTDYRILISRSDLRPHAQLYAFNLPDAIPKVELPLQGEDNSILLDLNLILDGVDQRAGYRFRIDYRQSITPAVSDQVAAWLTTLLVEQGLR